MDKKILEGVLKDAGKLKDGAYQLDSGGGHGLLVSAGSAITTLDDVTKVELCATHLVAHTARGERYFLDLAVVLGVKLGAPKSDGAGFV